MNMQYKRYQRACAAYDGADRATRLRILNQSRRDIDGLMLGQSAATVASQLFPSIIAFVEAAESALGLPEEVS